MNYITPVGFRDVMSDEALVREDLTARVRACFAQKGYRPVETPTLEVLDVMEAGGHVPEAPFKFFDSHGCAPTLPCRLPACAQRAEWLRASHCAYAIPSVYSVRKRQRLLLAN